MTQDDIAYGTIQTAEELNLWHEQHRVGDKNSFDTPYTLRIHSTVNNVASIGVFHGMEYYSHALVHVIVNFTKAHFVDAASRFYRGIGIKLKTGMIVEHKKQLTDRRLASFGFFDDYADDLLPNGKMRIVFHRSHSYRLVVIRYSS